MNILIINCSPKWRGGASAFFSGVLRPMLFPQKAAVKKLALSKNYEEIFEQLKNTDAVLLSSPLYIDGIPSHVLPFLERMEAWCRNNVRRFTLYLISNSGFIEGRQNRAHLAQYQCWCERAGVTWGGGLGIGGGVMLNVIFYAMFLLNIALFLVSAAGNILEGRPPLDAGLLASLGIDTAVWLFLCGGMFFCEGLLARAIAKRRSVKNRYTRVMLPAFLFLIVADIFMAISALLHGKLLFSLYRRRR